MSPKVFLGWLAATTATLVAAVAVTLSQPNPATVSLVNEPAFPTLRADPDAAARITIRQGGLAVTMERSADGVWATQEKDGYPADPAKLRALLVAMADMQLVERKTARAEGFKRLEVEDPDSEDAQSRQVTVAAEDGTLLAEALFGRVAERFTGGRDKGTYLRRPGDDHAWLAAGGPALPEDTIEWLAPQIVNIANDTVATIEIQPEDGEGYTVRRDPESADLILEPLPEGRQPKSSALSRLTSGLAFVELNDVRPKATFNTPETYPLARLTTEQGLEVTARLFKDGDDTWAAFEARATGATASDDGSADPAAEAAEINARVGAWVYLIDGFIVERLTLPLEELLEEDGTS
ncbi:MAG: DUF4340 domain-containing protein [Kiloniellales bacterium]|nr:DUF4340 domain-containing protein [Kiloniellales bacterium]